MGKFSETLKKALFEDTDDSQKSPVSKPKVESKPTPQSEPSSIPKIEVPSEKVGDIDKNILDLLEEKLRQENIPGPDYLELKETAMDPESVAIEPDEKKRYRQAFANMKRFFPSAGISKVRILGAIDHYVSVMEKEKKDALETLNQKRLYEIDSAEDALRKEREELEELEAQLMEKKKNLETKREKINEKRQELEQKERNFSATIDFMVDVFKKDKEKLNDYLND